MDTKGVVGMVTVGSRWQEIEIMTEIGTWIEIQTVRGTEIEVEIESEMG